MKNKKKLVEFIPFIALFVLGAAALLVYLLALGGRKTSAIAAACVCPFIALVVPLLNRVFKFRIPFSFNVAVSVFAVAAIYLGTVMGLYVRVRFYDKVMHTLFGVIGGLGAFIVLLHGRGEKMKSWCFFLSVFLMVMGVAALWEIYEYAECAAIGGNSQTWKPDLEAVGDMTVAEFFKSYNPLTDTIWDMIVAAFGVLIFFAGIFVDKLCGYKFCKRMYAYISDGVPCDGVERADERGATDIAEEDNNQSEK